jgi:hypothetical protein
MSIFSVISLNANTRAVAPETLNVEHGASPERRRKAGARLAA